MFDLSKRIALGAALGVPLVGGALPGHATAATSPPQPEERAKPNCVTTELTPAQLAAGQRSTLTCYATFAEALGSGGISVPADTQPVGLSDAAIASASDLAAVHFDGPNGSGASLSVFGSCNGGGVSLDPSWDNRISSTRHGTCRTIKHFDSTSYTGGPETTKGPDGATFDLTMLNDQVGSIKYFAS